MSTRETFWIINFQNFFLLHDELDVEASEPKWVNPYQIPLGLTHLDSEASMCQNIKLYVVFWHNILI